MAISVGDAVLKIAPSLEGFRGKLQEKLEAELKSVKAEVGVTLKPAFDRFRAELEAGLKATRPELGVDVDARTANASAHMAEWRADEETKNILQKIEVNTAAASAELAAWRAREERKPVKIPTEADTSGAERKLRTIRNVTGTDLFNVGNIAAATTAVAGLVAELGGVVAAAGAAGVALGAMGATLLTGMSGVFGAFKDLRAAQTSAGSDAKTRANQEVQSYRQIQDAQRAVRQGVTDLASAQRSMNSAWSEGARQLRDMNDQLTDSKFSQEDAVIALARAKENAARVNSDSSSSGLDRQEANLNVRKAQQALKEAQEKHADLKVDTAKANAAGIAGTPAVTSAQQQMTSAMDNLAKANQTLLRVQQDQARAAAQQGTQMDKFNEAMKRLSPNARDFVNQIRGLGGAWKELRTDVQDRLFAGLGDTFTRFARTQLPALRAGMGSLATFMNGMFKNTIDTISRTFSEFTADGTFSRFIQSTQDSFSGFVPVVDSVVRAMTHMVIDMGPELGRFFQNLAKFITDSTPTWDAFGNLALRTLSGLLPALNTLFTGLRPLAEVFGPLLVQLMTQLANAVNDNRDKIAAFGRAAGGVASVYLKTWTDLLVVLLPIITKVADIFVKIANMPGGSGFLASFLGIGLVFRTAVKPAVDLLNTVNATRLALEGMRSTKIGGTLFAGLSKALSPAASAAGTAKTAAGVWAINFSEGLKARIGPLRAGISQTLSKVFSGGSGARGGATVFSRMAAGAKVAFSAIATGAATAGRAMVVFTASLLTNPVFLIIAAIVALGAAFVVAYLKCKTFRDGVNNAVRAVVDFAVASFHRLMNNLKAVGQMFANLGRAIWDAMQIGYRGVAAVVGSINDIIVGFGRFLYNVFVGDWKGAWKAITDTFDAVLGRARNFFSSFTALASGIGEGIRKAFSGVVGILKQPIHVIGSLLAGLPTKIKIGPYTQSLGTSGIVNWGKSLQRLRDGGTAAGVDSGNILRGPGNGTSDSILGVDPATGVPTAWVSNREGVVNERGVQKHRGLFDAINRDDPRLADLPRLKDGGVPKNYQPAPAVPGSNGENQKPTFDRAWDVLLRSINAYGANNKLGSGPLDFNTFLAADTDSAQRYHARMFPRLDGNFQPYSQFYSWTADKGGPQNNKITHWYKQVWEYEWDQYQRKFNTDGTSFDDFINFHPELKRDRANQDVPPTNPDFSYAPPGQAQSLRTVDKQNYDRLWRGYFDKYKSGSQTFDQFLDQKRVDGATLRTPYAGGEGPPVDDEQIIIPPERYNGERNTGQHETPDPLTDGPPLPEAIGQPGAATEPNGEGGDLAAGSGDANDRAVAWAKAQEGKPYESPNNPPATWDCSSYMSGIYASFTNQDPNTRYFSTEGLSAGGDFENAGFVRGSQPGAFNIGVHRGGGGPNSHMAGTMPDGTNVESGGSHGVVAYGGAAAGANDPQFELHWYLPPDRWIPAGNASVSTDGSSGGGALDGLDMNGGGGGQYYYGDEGSEPPSGGSQSANDFSLQGVAEKGADIGVNFLLDFFGLKDSVLSSSNVYQQAVKSTLDGLDEASKDTSWQTMSLYDRFKAWANGTAGESKDKNGKKRQSTTGYVGTGDPDDPATTRMLNGGTGPDTTPGGTLQGNAPTSAPKAGSDGVFSFAQLVQLAASVGIPQGQTNTAGAIAEAESSGNPRATNANTNGTTDYGLWQINSGNEPPFQGSPASFDPLTNAKQMAGLYQQRGWQPWSTYNSGAYQKFLQGHADGGPVSGPGGPRDDLLIRRLSNGEFVMNADSTSAGGWLMHALNDSPELAGQLAGALAGGGPQGAAASVAATSSARLGVQTAGLAADFAQSTLNNIVAGFNPSPIAGNGLGAVRQQAPQTVTHDNSVNFGDIHGSNAKDIIDEANRKQQNALIAKGPRAKGF